MTEPVNVICMKWGTKFGPQYVNRLHRMVKRHLKRAHRFVCFTEDAKGLDAGVEVLPLPEVALPNGIPERGWRKLGTFAPQLGDLRGMALFLDLDILVVDSLDPFFEHPGEFCIIRDYKPLRLASYVGNSSVYRFEVGAWTGVLEHFRKEREQIREEFRNEQEYLSHYVHSRGKLVHWPSEWCPSFKRDCMWKFPLSLFRVPQIPQGAKVVVFHGHPTPEEALAGKSGSWKRFVKRTNWIADMWAE